MEIVVATGNQHKVAEITRIFKVPGVRIMGKGDLAGWPVWIESGPTFRDNALIKATACRDFFALPALADDSGLEVDYLGGLPGVMSARYAGDGANAERNNAKLLEALKGVPGEKRGARFRCVAVCLFDNEEALWSEGVCEGRIALEPSGAGGFGYDPLFVAEGMEVSMAELSPERKDAISHRGRAFRELASKLAAMLEASAERGGKR